MFRRCGALLWMSRFTLLTIKQTEVLMIMPRFRTTLVSTLALLVAPALFAMDTQNPRSASPAVPGTLNYVEGSVSVNGQPVTQQSVGSVILQPGENIS
ncbi:MAG TPA: hypothetical protein VGS02_12270, partial [Acidobacteriaceae bacterium]|nr:hypothetical protein [Acidobacteriaceae bacterium]